MSVTGDTSHLLHVVDFSDPNNIQLELTHQFTVGEGVPQSIDVCGNEVAVGLSAVTDVLEGHVMYFHTHTKGSGATDLVLEGYMTGKKCMWFASAFHNGMMVNMVLFFMKLYKSFFFSK